jgi:hypothetical protein
LAIVPSRDCSAKWDILCERPRGGKQQMLGFIRGTTTTAGLKVEAYLDEQIYRNGRRVTEEKLRGLAPKTIQPATPRLLCMGLFSIFSV